MARRFRSFLTALSAAEALGAAPGNGWRNADLLAGVKVSSGANLRLVQLQQDGWVQIQP